MKYLGKNTTGIKTHFNPFGLKNTPKPYQHKFPGGIFVFTKRPSEAHHHRGQIAQGATFPRCGG